MILYQQKKVLDIWCDGMKIFLSYLKSKQKDLFIICLFALVFSVVFMLYYLTLEPIVYSALLCLVIGLVFLFFDFYNYYKKHTLLHKLKDSITVSTDALPAPKDLLELDYQNLIATIYEHKAHIQSKADSAISNMIDYYTLWAHQIKTPIAAMYLLLQSEDSEQNLELSTELFKIEQYVEMALQYLRLDSSSTDFIIKMYDLDDIVKQAVRKYAKLFIRKRIGLDLAELNCQVLTDEKWLVFVIEQLLSNALKYTPQGKISIYMDRKKSKTLVIQDTGIGIQPEDLPRVFEKGFTGYNGRTDKKSTGIGLYLCKCILTKLSHTITIESEVGKGTVVKIDLDTIKTTME